MNVVTSVTDAVSDAVSNLLTPSADVPVALAAPAPATSSAVSSAPVEIPLEKTTVPKALQKTKQKKQVIGIYYSTLITKTISVNIVNIGSSLKQTLSKIISSQIEGKCIVEGYIKPRSTQILTYSSGLVKGSDVIFEVTFECLVCCPVEGMHIKCIAKNITKAGIRAETEQEPSPVVIFIARDHHFNNSYFNTIKENDEIKVRVIGQRYELNDKYISVIAELLEPKPEKYFLPKQKELEGVSAAAPASATSSTAAPATSSAKQVTVKKGVSLSKKPKLVIKE